MLRCSLGPHLGMLPKRGRPSDKKGQYWKPLTSLNIKHQPMKPPSADFYVV